MSNPYKEKALRELLLGLRVDKAAAMIDSAADDLFTVYGMVLITLIEGECTGVGDGTVETILLEEKASSIKLCAATTVTSDAVGDMYMLGGDAGEVFNGADAPALKVAQMAGKPLTPYVFNGGSAGLIIELTASAGTDATLAAKWTLFYIPLEEGAYVVAA